MVADPQNIYRSKLSAYPPAFEDIVHTPWETIPDLTSYNQAAYNALRGYLSQMQKKRQAAKGPVPSQGVLLCGEAGTGKSHLLMRIARELSRENYILFVPRPNSTATLTLQVWAHVMSSLTQKLPGRSDQYTQLDDLLAHVFSNVLIPQFEATGAPEQHRVWANRLKQDPLSLMRMLGTGKQAASNLRVIRNRTLKFLTEKHGMEIDRTIAHAMITYCLIREDRRRKNILCWLSGQGGLDATEVAELGLPADWGTPTGEPLSEQEREEQAFRALKTLGILSGYYQPFILCFDQLEGLRGDAALTRKWSDTVREIINYVPNMLVLSCMWLSNWEKWFLPNIDISSAERIASKKIELDSFQPHHGKELLQAHLADTFVEHSLPTPIYPFTEEMVAHLAAKARSPRSFLQAAAAELDSWLFAEAPLEPESRTQVPVLTTEAIEAVLRTEFHRLERNARTTHDQAIPVEEELFGRMVCLLKAFLSHLSPSPRYEKVTLRKLVLPVNIIVQMPNGPKICFCVMNAVSNSLTSRLRNLRESFANRAQYDALIVLRDARCGRPGPVGQEYLAELKKQPFAYIEADQDEFARFNALYELIVRLEQHDLSIGTRILDFMDLRDFLRREGLLRQCQLFTRAHELSKLFADIL
jgi:hypothetical protein